MAIGGSGGAYYRASPAIPNTENFHTGWQMHLMVQASATPSTADLKYVGGMVGQNSQSPDEMFLWNHTNASFVKSWSHRNGAGTYVSAQLTSTPAANVWHSIFARFDGTNVRISLNGTLEGTSASGTAGSSSIGVNADLLAAITSAGALNGASQFSTGRVAEFAIWTNASALTTDEIVSLAKGLRPRRVRPQLLFLYAPCVRDFNDVMRGRVFSKIGGTDVFEDHPRVYG